MEKGPKDLREIPRYFGQAAAAVDYGACGHRDPRRDQQRGEARPAEEIRAAADYFRASGADVIDIGCTPGVPFPALGDVVRELRGAGMRVSVDSFEPSEIRTAVEAGAELVLSVNGSEPGRGTRARGQRRAGGGDSRFRRGDRHPGGHAGRRSSAGACRYLIDP